MKNNQIKDLSRQFSDVERDRLRAFCDILGLDADFSLQHITGKESVTMKSKGDFYVFRVYVIKNEETQERELLIIEKTLDKYDRFVTKNISDLDKYFKTFNA
jgi:hypothetical protein